MSCFRDSKCVVTTDDIAFDAIGRAHSDLHKYFEILCYGGQLTIDLAADAHKAIKRLASVIRRSERRRDRRELRLARERAYRPKDFEIPSAEELNGKKPKKARVS